MLLLYTFSISAIKLFSPSEIIFLFQLMKHWYAVTRHTFDAKPVEHELMKYSFALISICSPLCKKRLIIAKISVVQLMHILDALRAVEYYVEQHPNTIFNAIVHSTRYREAVCAILYTIFHELFVKMVYDNRKYRELNNFFLKLK